MIDAVKLTKGRGRNKRWAHQPACPQLGNDLGGNFQVIKQQGGKGCQSLPD